MSIVTAIYHFEVENLWVEQSLLGMRSSIEFGGYTCTLALPQDGTGFFSVQDENLDIQLLGGWVQDREGRRLKTAVKWLRVEVEMASDLTADRFTAEERPAGLEERAEETLARGSKVARDLATQYVRWVRVVSDQPWLGPSTLTVSRGRRSFMLDVDGKLISTGSSLGGHRVRMFHRQPALAEADHGALLGAIARDEEPALAETLLSDAEHVSSEAAHPDLRLGVLLAAIACEVKVKEALAAVAHPLQRGALDVMLNHFRDVSIPVNLLFHVGMKAICGRSLSDENKVLFSRVQKMFSARNKVAHMGGKALQADENLLGHVETAREAFAWLNSVVAEHQPSETAGGADG